MTTVPAEFDLRIDLSGPAAAAGIGSAGPSNVQVDLNARPTSAALSANSGAGLIGWLRAEPGAFARTTADVLEDRLSVMDFIPLPERAAIRLRTSTTDHTAYLQAAIDVAIARKQHLHLPYGDYNVSALTVALTAVPDAGCFSMGGDSVKGARLKKFGTGAAPIISVSHAVNPQTADVDISDLGIFGNAHGSDAVQLVGLGSVRLRRLFIISCNIAVNCEGLIASEIEYSYFGGNAIGVRVRSSGTAAYSNANTIRSCRIADNHKLGIDFGGGSNLRISECDIERNGGTPVTISQANPAVITWTAHGFAAGAEVRFVASGGTLPTGLTAGTPYYVLASDLTANTFQVAAIPGGGAIATTSAGSGSHLGVGPLGSVGGVIVRDTVDDEIGYGIIVIDKSWLEGSYGRSIQFEAVTGAQLFAQISNCNVVASDGGRAIHAGGGGFFQLTNVIAPSPGDTFSMTCTMLSMQTCFVHTLSGTQTHPPAIIGSAFGSTTVEGNVQGALHQGGGYQLKQTWVNGTAGYQLGPNTNVNRYEFRSLGLAAQAWDFDGHINIPTAKELRVNGQKVVTDRKTGWAVATGTATRTTFDTATVTTAQLAERVKALIDDLHATVGHGLIGS